MTQASSRLLIETASASLRRTAESSSLTRSACSASTWPSGRPSEINESSSPVGTNVTARCRSKEALRRVVGAFEDGVVDRAAVDPAVGGQHPGLRLDLLRGEDPL